MAWKRKVPVPVVVPPTVWEMSIGQMAQWFGPGSWRYLTHQTSPVDSWIMWLRDYYQAITLGLVSEAEFDALMDRILDETLLIRPDGTPVPGDEGVCTAATRALVKVLMGHDQWLAVQHMDCPRCWQVPDLPHARPNPLHSPLLAALTIYGPLV